MTKQEEAQKEWRLESEERYEHRVPALALAYRDGISDFKSALKARIEKEIENCTYHPGKYGLHRALELIDETKPLK